MSRSASSTMRAVTARAAGSLPGIGGAAAAGCATATAGFDGAVAAGAIAAAVGPLALGGCGGVAEAGACWALTGFATEADAVPALALAGTGTTVGSNVTCGRAAAVAIVPPVGWGRLVITDATGIDEGLGWDAVRCEVGTDLHVTATGALGPGEDAPVPPPCTEGGELREG